MAEKEKEKELDMDPDMDMDMEERLVDAVRPTLFTAARRPEQLGALLLAHLMSPRLWELAVRAADGAHGPAETLGKIRRFVDAHFWHARKEEFGRLWGLQERERIGDAAGREANDEALAAIAKGIAQTAVGGDPENVPLVELALEGTFPLYVYPTVEVILAHRPRLRHLSHSLLGLTSCLDECVLVGAMAVATGEFALEGLALLGSPFHYALLATSGGEPFLVNAKRELLDAASFRAAAAGGPDAVQEAVDARLFAFDRIVTPRGACVLPAGPATLPPGDLESLAEASLRLFGTEIRQVRQARERIQAAGPAGRSDPPDLSPLRECRSAAAFEGRVLALGLAQPGSLFDEALHVFRHPRAVPERRLRDAAARGFHVFLESARIGSVAEARARAEAVAGTGSIFGDSGRMALPDEVIVFDTGNTAERRLLAETLARLAAIDPGVASS